jgi:hypothetical protein
MKTTHLEMPRLLQCGVLESLQGRRQELPYFSIQGGREMPGEVSALHCVPKAGHHSGAMLTAPL